ncbi:MAG TPA: ABC transporter ATP-binding protein [Candidatus Methylomirabilis sp.]
MVVRNLSKYYLAATGDVVRALHDITFDVSEGEFVTVVGPSGCGKTTLLMILGGLLSKTKGEVQLSGTPVNGPRRDIGIVFQSSVLLPWRTVLQNTLLTAEILALDPRSARARAMALLDLVGLHGFEDKYPKELSGGMQQRAAITRALLHDPAILLMDEPFGALDAMTREQMNLELQRIWRESGKTILLITHSIPEAVFLGDRVLVMTPRPGKLAETIQVGIPRPRSLDVMATPRFGEITHEIRALFQQKGAID